MSKKYSSNQDNASFTFYRPKTLSILHYPACIAPWSKAHTVPRRAQGQGGHPNRPSSTACPHSRDSIWPRTVASGDAPQGRRPHLACPAEAVPGPRYGRGLRAGSIRLDRPTRPGGSLPPAAGWISGATRPLCPKPLSWPVTIKPAMNCYPS